MTNNEISTKSASSTKRPTSRKHRSHSPGESIEKNLVNDCRTNKTSTVTSRPPSKLPSLPSKAAVHSTISKSMQSKRNLIQQQDQLNSSSSKSEQQLSNTSCQPRLPTLYRLTSDYDQRRLSEIRRRQIYALNHLMRELEQEQFHQYYKPHGVGIDNQENTIGKNDNKNKDSFV